EVGFLEIQLDNGARLVRGFDEREQTTHLELRDSTDTSLHGVELVRGPAGDVLQRTRTVDGVIDELSYDPLRRLVQYAHDVQGQTAGQRLQTWSLDLADNWLEKTDDNGTPSSSTPWVNDLDQYLDFEPWTTIDHDDLGQEIYRETSNGSRTTTWDAFGRPIATAVTSAGATQTVFWFYDALDRLVARFRSAADYTRWTYLGDLLIESDHSGTVQSYVEGPHGIYRLSGTGVERYLHVDPFSNITAVHDGMTVLEEYEYDPYGEPRDPQSGAMIAGSGEGNELFFLGKPFDFFTRWVRTTYRHYDPALGRFIRRDPLREGGGLNLYGYANQNPLSYFDPTGLTGQQIEAGPPAIPESARFSAGYLAFRVLQENDLLEQYTVFHHVDTKEGQQDILNAFADLLGVDPKSIDNFLAASIFGQVRDNNNEILNYSEVILDPELRASLIRGVHALEDAIAYRWTYEANELLSAIPGYGIISSVGLIVVDVANGDYQKALYRTPNLIPGIKTVKSVQKAFRITKTARSLYKTEQALRALKITTTSLKATHQLRNGNVLDAAVSVVGGSRLPIEAQIGAKFAKAESDLLHGNWKASVSGVLKILVGLPGR
ncbi:MAG: RHS repeat-associated core domain-containing protein, partial [Planctomycetes bacterium]|nr:RHS repeat-associated core domain-containing protein [Planctomycetota bacterium]